MKNNKSLKKIIAGIVAISLSVTTLVLPISATGWVASNGQYYYQKANGSYATGWLQVGNYRYYLNSKCQAVKGFQKINGKTYYFGNDYALYHGAVQQGKNVYFFDVNGAWYKTLTTEQLKAQLVRAPQGALKQAYSEPVRYNSKGVNQGYSDSMNWYACLDANFWKLFGNGSTKASTVANMPEEYKYQIYCASNIMNMLCIPNSTYQAYKKEASNYLKSLKFVTYKPHTYSTYTYYALVPSGNYKNIKLHDLHLYKPLYKIGDCRVLLSNAYTYKDTDYKSENWGLDAHLEVSGLSEKKLFLSENIGYYYVNNDRDKVEFYELKIYSDTVDKGKQFTINSNVLLGYYRGMSTGWRVTDNAPSISTTLVLNLDKDITGDSYSVINKGITTIKDCKSHEYSYTEMDYIPDIIYTKIYLSDNNEIKWSKKYKSADIAIYYLPTTGERLIRAHKMYRDSNIQAEYKVFTSLADAEDFIFN